MIRKLLVTASAVIFCLLIAGCDSGTTDSSVPGRDKERERPAEPQKAPGMDIQPTPQEPTRGDPTRPGSGGDNDSGGG